MNLIITIPVYNEERSIDQVISKLLFTLNKIEKKYKQINKFIILTLDDCSNDSTKNKIQKYLKKKHTKRIVVKYKQSKKNIGKSKIIFDEFKRNSKNLIFITDGDCELSPENIKYFLKYYFLNDVDLICGYRNLKLKNENFFQNYIYSFGSLFSNFIINLGFKKKINDVHCGQKLFKIQSFPKFFCFKFSLDIELGLFFLKSQKKIYNLKLKKYKRRNTHQGKKLGFLQGINLIWQTIFIKIYY